MGLWFWVLACTVPSGLVDDDTGTILSVGTTPDTPAVDADCDRHCPVAADDACEQLACYLYEECCIPGGAPPAGGQQQCASGTPSACAAECGLQADCRVFLSPEDPEDEDYLEAVAEYTDCLNRC